MCHKSDEGSPSEETEQSSVIRAEPTCCEKIVKLYFDYEILILMVLAILLARIYPPLGAEYLYPQITARWIAVIITFFLAGLSLKTEEFSKAFRRVYFNAFVQIFNFGVVSAIVFGISRGLVQIGALSERLADGMIVGACLPITINTVLVMTENARGDEAASIFNAAFGNMVGVFLSPLLILGYLGVKGDVDLAKIFESLTLRVILPFVVGQILHSTSRLAVAFVTKYKYHVKQAQMYALVYIVYTVFCRTFQNEAVSSVGDILLMILYQCIILCGVMVLAWYSLKLCFPNEPALRVMGLFGCTQKTMSLGVPLINAIYPDSPNLGVYTLPLLIWHSVQLVIGSAVTPWLIKFVESERQRLGLDKTGDLELKPSGRTDTECEEVTQHPTDEEAGVFT